MNDDLALIRRALLHYARAMTERSRQAILDGHSVSALVEERGRAVALVARLQERSSPYEARLLAAGAVMPLNRWADKHGIHHRTARDWARSGRLHGAVKTNNRWTLPDQKPPERYGR